MGPRRQNGQASWEPGRSSSSSSPAASRRKTQQHYRTGQERGHSAKMQHLFRSKVNSVRVRVCVVVVPVTCDRDGTVVGSSHHVNSHHSNITSELQYLCACNHDCGAAPATTWSDGGQVFFAGCQALSPWYGTCSRVTPRTTPRLVIYPSRTARTGRREVSVPHPTVCVCLSDCLCARGLFCTAAVIFEINHLLLPGKSNQSPSPDHLPRRLLQPASLPPVFCLVVSGN